MTSLNIIIAVRDYLFVQLSYRTTEGVSVVFMECRFDNSHTCCLLQHSITPLKKKLLSILSDANPTIIITALHIIASLYLVEDLGNRVSLVTNH